MWQEWMKYASVCFESGMRRLRCSTSSGCTHYFLDPEPSLFDRSKTKKTRIPTITDANGMPDIPSVTAADGYHTKIVQAALREYCTAHIREPVPTCY